MRYQLMTSTGPITATVRSTSNGKQAVALYHGARCLGNLLLDNRWKAETAIRRTARQAGLQLAGAGAIQPERKRISPLRVGLPFGSGGKAPRAATVRGGGRR